MFLIYHNLNIYSSNKLKKIPQKKSYEKQAVGTYQTKKLRVLFIIKTNTH